MLFRTLCTWILVSLISTLTVACERRPRYKAVTDPTQRLQFQGFSILPPKGEHWFILEQSATEVSFRKQLKQIITQPAEAHTLVAGAAISEVKDVKFASPTEFLHFVEREEKRGL